VSETACILAEAWKDPDWGTLIWLTMMGGNRRGELCGIRWRHVDLDREVIHIQRAIGQYGSETWEGDTKSESDRRAGRRHPLRSEMGRLPLLNSVARSDRWRDRRSQSSSGWRSVLVAASPSAAALRGVTSGRRFNRR
jgi:integrase